MFVRAAVWLLVCADLYNWAKTWFGLFLNCYCSSAGFSQVNIQTQQWRPELDFFFLASEKPGFACAGHSEPNPIRAVGPSVSRGHVGRRRPGWTGAGLRCHAPVLLVVPEAWGGGAGQQEGGAPPRAKLRGYCLHRHSSCFPWPVGAGNEQHCLAAHPEVCWVRQLA